VTHAGTWLRRGLITATVVSIAVLVYRAMPPTSYYQDPQQEYLSARALRDGVNIFTPVAELALRYFPFPVPAFPHPNPHPPLLVLLSVPLSFLPFPLVIGLWFVANVALLIRVGTWLGLSRWWSLSLVVWPPVRWVIDVNQLELLLLAMTMVAFVAADRGKDREAGIWLGVAASLKLYPLFFLLPFVARRNYKLVGTAGAVFALGQLVNLIVVGPQGLLTYYVQILPGVSALYQRGWLNSSPYGVFSRIFGWSTQTSPIVEAPDLVLPLTLLFAAVGIAVALKLSPKAGPLAMLLTIPNGWSYYAVLALPQMAVLWRRFGPTKVMVASLVCCSIVQADLPHVAPLISSLTGWEMPTNPPLFGLVTALQMVGYIGLLGLTVKAEKGAELALWARKLFGARQPARLETHQPN
jgi:Glycosyltransferase family 87